MSRGATSTRCTRFSASCRMTLGRQATSRGTSRSFWSAAMAASCAASGRRSSRKIPSSSKRSKDCSSRQDCAVSARGPRMKVVAESFSWPFRGDWKSRWLPGLLTVLLLPIAFIPLLGYAVAAARAAELDPAIDPPRWALSSRLLSDGFWTSLAVVVLTAPFVLVLNPFAGLLFDAQLWH